jgi:hypothetical protein
VNAFLHWGIEGESTDLGTHRRNDVERVDEIVKTVNEGIENKRP